MVECDCGAKNNVTGKAAGTRVKCSGCDEVFTTPNQGETADDEVRIDEWSGDQIKKQCKPVLVYYYTNPITDAKNPNWIFCRKMEMQCFTRKDNQEMLKSDFALEKVSVAYPVKTDRGKIIPDRKKPNIKSWDYKISKVIFTTFDGEQKIMELTAKQAKSSHLKSANFTKLLKMVQAKNAKYIKKLKKRHAKERALEAKAAKAREDKAQ